MALQSIIPALKILRKKKKKVLRQEDCKYQGTAVSDTYWDSVFKKGKRKEEKRRSEGRREAENGEDRRRTQSPPMGSSSGPFNIHQPWWNLLLARAFGFLTTLSLAPVEPGLLLEARSPVAHTTWEKQTCEQGWEASTSQLQLMDPKSLK